MADENYPIKDLIKKYIDEIERNNIPVQRVILFGSYAKGNFKDESDIDVAIISPAFTGDRFEDRRRIVPLRRKIDNRIEPIPLTPEDFDKGGNFIDEIKKIGKLIEV